MPHLCPGNPVYGSPQFADALEVPGRIYCAKSDKIFFFQGTSHERWIASYITPSLHSKFGRIANCALCVGVNIDTQ